jgi:transcriptional regulator with XRE-family HTH domain
MLSQKIEKRIQEIGLTVNSAAKKCGLSHATLWNIIKKRRNPSLKIVKQISDGLSISIEELVKDEDDFTEIMSDPELKIMFEKVGKLSPQARKSIIEFINYAYDQEKKK